jgi:hypothetical protein
MPRTAIPCSSVSQKGGTNLLDLMKLQIETPRHLIDVNGLALDRIEPTPHGGLRIRRTGAQFRSRRRSARASRLLTQSRGECANGPNGTCPDRAERCSLASLYGGHLCVYVAPDAARRENGGGYIDTSSAQGAPFKTLTLQDRWPKKRVG